jgi:hypothetical protein
MGNSIRVGPNPISNIASIPNQQAPMTMIPPHLITLTRLPINSNTTITNSIITTVAVALIIIIRTTRSLSTTIKIAAAVLGEAEVVAVAMAVIMVEELVGINSQLLINTNQRGSKNLVHSIIAM